jgi:tetrahydromethanopterin S-methyltransferase subunit G
MSEETKLVGVTLPQKQYLAIIDRLGKLETVQDFIRQAITEKIATTEVKA